jgi:hypothetical protein
MNLIVSVTVPGVRITRNKYRMDRVTTVNPTSIKVLCVLINCALRVVEKVWELRK